ncbi:hypothetical protein JXB41_02130 [Candidatus Woesearchaeota archaeon]|nr:hypothetical protein [Candidatus Woesearchaeota archaeon]
MTYVVITGNNRKEFEKLREAISYSTVQSRIYEGDAFGNMMPLNKKMIDEKLQYEPIAKPVQKEQKETEEQKPVQEKNAKPFDQKKKNLVDYREIEQKELGNMKIETKEEKKEKSKFTIINYIIYIILIAIIIYVAYLIIAPYWKEFTADSAYETIMG